jgi:hypothetical protein
MKKITKGLLLIFTVLLFVVGLVAARVYTYRDAGSEGPADAAVVLGAAVWVRKSPPSSGSASTTALTSTGRDGSRS